MKYHFYPIGYPYVTVDDEKSQATFSNGKTVDIVGGEFTHEDGTRFRFHGPEPGRVFADLTVTETKVVAHASGRES